MSYSSELKIDLCKYGEESDKYIIPECYGMMLFSRDFSHEKIMMTTENQEVAEHYQTALQLSLGINAMIIEPGEGHVFHVSIEEKPEREKALTYFGHPSNPLILGIQKTNLENENSGRAFIRGAYIAAGSMDNPNNRYHMEIIAYSQQLSDDLSDLLASFGIRPLRSKRNAVHVIYFRDSESIEDMLTLMGAADKAMDLMNLKIYKNFRNIANRRTNCETANISRTVNASSGQVTAIYNLQKSGGFYLLTDELQEVALLRIMNPEMSIAEIATATGLSRSGANHRLRKIMQIADEYKTMINSDI